MHNIGKHQITPEKILSIQNRCLENKYVLYHPGKKLMWHLILKCGYLSARHIILEEKDWATLPVASDPTDFVSDINEWQLMDALNYPETYRLYLSETEKHIAFVRNPVKRLYSALAQEFVANVHNHGNFPPKFKDMNLNKLLYMSDDVFYPEYIFSLLCRPHCCPQFYFMQKLGDTRIPQGTDLYDLSTISTVMADLFPENKIYAERAKVIKNTSLESNLKVAFSHKLQTVLDKNSQLKDFLRSWVDCDYDRLLADANVKHLAKETYNE